MGARVGAVRDAPVDLVVEGRPFLGGEQADDVRLAGGCALVRLGGGEVVAAAVVLDGEAGGLAGGGEGFEAVRAAEAAVGGAVEEELLGVGAVEGGAFGLEGRLVRHGRSLGGE